MDYLQMEISKEPRRRRRPLVAAAPSGVTPLADTALSVRTVNALERLGVFTVADLLKRTPDQLMAANNFGDKTMEELHELLKGIGLPLPKAWKPGRRHVTPRKH